jgi:hypothetical protein
LTSNTEWSPALILFEAAGNQTFGFGSNSTITQLGFNTASQVLTFTVSGPTGTDGYTKVTFAKSLVANPDGISVLEDGQQVYPSVVSMDDTWLLSINYTHSTHDFEIDLGEGATFLSNFDNLFKFNSVRMIYPSEQTPKPLDCSAAMVSDWLSSAFIYTKLETVVEGIDTDGAFVNQTTGKPLGAADSGIISFGGPIVNPVVAYAEGASTPAGDRAPLKFYANAETFYFQLQDGTSIIDANLPVSVINNNQDMFVIESYRDADGRYMLLCYGFGWKGTYAAGKYFNEEIYPNIASYSHNWIIVKWDDTNANGFVNTAADGDTYTVIATG